MPSQMTLDTIKGQVYGLHLSTEQNEKIIDMIETAYRLGLENGYDEAGRRYTPMILDLMSDLK